MEPLAGTHEAIRFCGTAIKNHCLLPSSRYDFRFSTKFVSHRKCTRNSFLKKRKRDGRAQQLTLTEVWVLHRLSCREPVLVIVSEKFVEKVDRFGADEMLVLAVDESLPALSENVCHKSNTCIRSPGLFCRQSKLCGTL